MRCATRHRQGRDQRPAHHSLGRHVPRWAGPRKNPVAREIRKLAQLGVKYTGELILSPVPGPTQQELLVLRAMLDEGSKLGVGVQVHATSTSAMDGGGEPMA